MAQTRAATGHSKPRVFAAVEDAVAPKKSAANTSKPRAKKVTAGRVEKKPVAPKPKVVKKTPAAAAKDKVVGKAKKAVGAVEGKPAKKAAGTKKEKTTTTTTKKATPTKAKKA